MKGMVSRRPIDSILRVTGVQQRHFRVKQRREALLEHESSIVNELSEDFRKGNLVTDDLRHYLFRRKRTGTLFGLVALTHRDNQAARKMRQSPAARERLLFSFRSKVIHQDVNAKGRNRRYNNAVSGKRLWSVRRRENREFIGT